MDHAGQVSSKALFFARVNASSSEYLWISGITRKHQHKIGIYSMPQVTMTSCILHACLFSSSAVCRFLVNVGLASSLRLDSVYRNSFSSCEVSCTNLLGSTASQSIYLAVHCANHTIQLADYM